MTCNYTLTESELINAMQLSRKGSYKARIILFIVSTVLLILISIFTKYSEIGIYAFVGGLIGYFISIFLIIPYSAKKQYRQRRGLRNNINMNFSEQGINFKSEHGESIWQWRDIHKWKYSKSIFLLYISSNMFHIVPSRVLHDETEFKKLLNKHIGSREK